MSGNASLYAQQIENYIPGEGYRVSDPAVNLHSIKEANGLVLTAGTTPTIAAIETNAWGIIEDSAGDLGELNYVVPQDYSIQSDELLLQFLAESAGDTDTPTIDATVYQKRVNTALSGDLDPTISAAVPTNTVGADWVTLDISDQDLQPGDALTITLTASTHGTDALHVYAVRMTYRSNIAFTTLGDRN